ncbi:MAG: hypothetical protein RSD42_01850 [Oscillospiraceae bacterium]
MWITKQLTQRENSTAATSAQVTLSDSNEVCTAGSSENRYVSVYAPYGIETRPPIGAQVLLLESEDGIACAGVLCHAQQIQEGEIRLFSKGGASIVLKNSGDITLNGVTIPKQG